jgi:hypothetical protein
MARFRGAKRRERTGSGRKARREGTGVCDACEGDRREHSGEREFGREREREGKERREILSEDVIYDG